MENGQTDKKRTEWVPSEADQRKQEKDEIANEQQETKTEVFDGDIEKIAGKRKEVNDEVSDKDFNNNAGETDVDIDVDINSAFIAGNGKNLSDSAFANPPPKGMRTWKFED